jgi:hypothetical protein
MQGKNRVDYPSSRGYCRPLLDFSGTNLTVDIESGQLHATSSSFANRK